MSIAGHEDEGASPDLRLDLRMDLRLRRRAPGRWTSACGGGQMGAREGAARRAGCRTAAVGHGELAGSRAERRGELGSRRRRERRGEAGAVGRGTDGTMPLDTEGLSSESWEGSWKGNEYRTVLVLNSVFQFL